MYRKTLNVIEHPRALRKKSLQLPEVLSEKDSSDIKDLVETFTVMQGYGLAAPQIGIFKRVVCINPKLLGLSEESEILTMINPKVEAFGDLERNKESWLIP